MEQMLRKALSIIVPLLILLGTAGMSVERCSCTGRVSVVFPSADDCCPTGSSCKTTVTMQLSDYVPTAATALDPPLLPFLATTHLLVDRPTPLPLLHTPPAAHGPAPPGHSAETIAILRV